MRLFRDAGAVDIEVGAPNRPGTKCYKKCGFIAIDGLNLRSDLTAINSNATLRSSQRFLDLPELNTDLTSTALKMCHTKQGQKRTRTPSSLSESAKKKTQE